MASIMNMREVSYEEAMAMLLAPTREMSKKDGIITIIVGTGEDRVQFEVDKGLLSTWSQVFNEYLFNNPFVAEIDRPDEDPHTFSLLIQWLYNDDENALPTDLPSVSTTLPEAKTQLLKFLARVSKTQYATEFRRPVADMWPEFAAQYLEIIENLIDLATISSKLDSDQYLDINELMYDFDLLYDNTARFNGPDHQITKAASTLRTKVFDKIVALNITSEAPGSEQSRERRHALHKLICLSERYRFKSLTNACIDELIHLYNTHRTI